MADAPGTIRILRNEYAGVVTEGAYEKQRWNEWTLRRWRVTVNGSVGKWHRVNRNRKRPIGWLDIDRTWMPEHAQKENDNGT